MSEPAVTQNDPVDPCVTCHRCGCQSPLADLFRHRGGEYTCPSCLEDEAREKGQTYLWALGGLTIFFLLVAFLPFGQPPLIVALANLAWLLIALALLVAWHELGHVIALRLMRGRLFAVRWGSGGDIRRWRWQGVAIYVGRNLFSGFTMGGFLERTALRLRFAVYVLGGIVANLALAGMLLWWHSDKPMRLLGDGIFWSEMLILASLIQAAGALLPIRASVGAIKVPTDGAWLLQLLTGRVNPELIHQLYFANGVMQASALDDVDAMSEMAAQAMRHYPDEPWAQEIDMMDKVMRGDGSESLDWYSQVLASSPLLTGPKRAVLLNNAAWSGLLVGGERQLATALERVRLAFGMMPWFAPIRGTYGSLLVEHGDLKGGIAHLQWALAHHQGIRDKGLVTAYLALASALDGEFDQASAMICDAEYLAGGDPLIERIRERIDTLIRST